MASPMIRVYRLAHEMRVTSDVVLAAAHRLGYHVLNQLSSLDAVQIALIKAELGPPPPEEPTGVGAKLPPRGPAPVAAHEAKSTR